MCVCCIPGAWLGLVKCSLLRLFLWDAGHLAEPLLPMWTSRSFPNIKSRILGGMYHLVSSTGTFLSSRVGSWESSAPREAAAHPPGQGQAGLGLQRLLEKPSLHWSDQPVPLLDTDPWRYRRDPVLSRPWGHTSSPVPSGLCLQGGQQGHRDRHLLGILAGGTA